MMKRKSREVVFQMIEKIIDEFNLRKENKKLRRYYIRNEIMGLILIVILSLMLIVMLLFYKDVRADYLSGQNYYDYYGYPEIDYSRLNSSMKLYAESLIDKINPDYLMSAKKILFTTNLSDIELNKNNVDGEIVYDGETYKSERLIKVYLFENEDRDLRIIMHELCHTYTLYKYEEMFCEGVEGTNFMLK